MQHDPSGACAPGGSGGNFIMFAQATDGALPNNKRFSSCSNNRIRAVLNDKSSCFAGETHLLLPLSYLLHNCPEVSFNLSMDWVKYWTGLSTGPG